ncbi:MAG TPA: helix-turn-helix domain-containing protein [Polyangia bacterium]|jgi:flagellar biosynthesis protein FlhG
MTEKPEFPDEFEDDDESVDVEVDDPVSTAESDSPAAAPAPSRPAPLESAPAAPSVIEEEPTSSPELESSAVVERPFAPVVDDEPTPHLIAIASGRGGAGKSLLAANIAVYLAQIGKRVVAVDADPAGGALHHMLGAPRPARGLGSFLRGHVASLEELAVDTPVAGVRLIAGEMQPFGAPKPKMGAKPLLAALRDLGADTVVIDLGPADFPLCIDVWLGAETPIVVTLSDPPSIDATYRFVRSGFLRKVRGERGVDKLQAQVGRALPGALDLYRAAADVGRVDRDTQEAGTPGPDSGPTRTPSLKASALVASLAQAMATYHPRFVVSQTRSLGDTRLGTQMAMAAHRRLGHRFDYLGHMEADETVTAASRRHRPVMAEFPEAKICKNIERIVRRILSTEAERPAASVPLRLEEDQTFYEILETQPGVSDEEVRRAYRSMKEIYASGSPAIFGLYDDAELAALHARANAAHDTLFAPERRRLYDLSLPEGELVRAVRWAAQAPREPHHPSPARGGDSAGVPVIDASTEITGALLKKIRETKGLELSEVAQRTKIGERHLRAIEGERFDELPAPVYVRGFITQIARFLRIDPTRAAEGFLRRFHGVNGPGAGSPALKEL